MVVPKKSLDDTLEDFKNTDIEIKDKSELGEVMDNLDQDKIDPETKMSSIDFNARLSSMEISSSMIIDELQRAGIFPEDAGITRQKKRLSVSLKGKGREEKVEVVKGERMNRSGEGVMGKFGNLFRPQGK